MSFGIALGFFFRRLRAMFQHLVRSLHHRKQVATSTNSDVSIAPKQG
jgi:hypothetical protein